MKSIRRSMLVAIALVSVQCREASAPEPAKPIVSPSGRIAFVTQVSPGSGGLYIVNTDGTGLRQLHSGPRYYSRPRWSPDRRRIAFSVTSTNPLTSSVMVIDVDGPEGVVRLGDGSDPAWSPDGSKIVFTWRVAPVTTAGWGIHVMNADGSNVRRLTSPNDPAQCSEGSSANDLKPDWSPDGQKILFERQIHIDDNFQFDCGLDGYGLVPNVYVVNVDGTDARRLRSVDWSAGDFDPAWSPDGRSIAYSTYSGGLYIVDADATRPADQVTSLITGIPLMPTWSADGKKLLVLGATPPTNKLFIVDIEAGTTTLLGFLPVPGLLLDPAWSR